MTTYYPVCAADMTDCSKKCTYFTMRGDAIYQSRATDCSNPCACYGSNYALEDALCKNGYPAPPSNPSFPKDDTYGQTCPGGITLVTVCNSPGTATYKYFSGCQAANVTAQVGDAAYVTDTESIPPYGTCSWPFVQVQGFGGILIEFTPPYADVTTCCPYQNLNEDTCGSPYGAVIYAQGSNGVTYLETLAARIFYGPFTSYPTISSVDPVVLTQPHPTLCNSCGGDGQPECPDTTDTVYDSPQAGTEEWFLDFLDDYLKPRLL